MILTLTAQTGYYIYRGRVEEVGGEGGSGSLYRFEIRRQIKQTVHTSSNNNQYIFMPVLYARDLTRLDGFKQYGLITSTEDTA